MKKSSAVLVFALSSVVFASGLFSMPKAWAASDSDQALKVPRKYKSFELKAKLEPLPGLVIYNYFHKKSGLDVFLVPQATTHSDAIAYVTAYNVGSRFEVQGRTGLAHLFEHLMFRGTPSFPAPFQTLSEWGDQFNAYTSSDHTLYHELVPREVFEDVVKFESERMRNLSITPEGFKTERGAVISERKMSTEDSPFGRLDWELNQLAFDVHPYKTGPIGWQEDLDATTFDDAQNFYKKFYSPQRAKIALVGDFNLSETLKLLDKYYGSFTLEPFKEPDIKQEPVRKDYRRQILPMKSESVMIADAVWGMKFDDPHLPAESLVCTILADAKLGYLAKELVDQGIARKVSADCGGGTDPGLTQIFLIGNPGLPLKKVEAAYDRVMKNFPSFLTQSHLDKAKLFYFAEQWSSLRNPMNLAEQLARSATVDNDPLFEFAYLNRVNKVTLDEVKADYDSWATRAHVRMIVEPSDHTAPMVRKELKK